MGGQTVCFGDIDDKSSIMLDYFERNGAPHCDADANPAEYMLDTIWAGASATTSIDWRVIWMKSPEVVAHGQWLRQNVTVNLLPRGSGTKPPPGFQIHWWSPPTVWAE